MTVTTAICIIGAAVVITAAVWAMRRGGGGAYGFLLNAVSGGALFLGLSAFGVISVPINAFTVAAAGTLGLPGAGMAIAAAALL